MQSKKRYSQFLRQKRISFGLALLLISCGASGLIAQESGQTWTDVTGKKKIEAEFVKLNGVSLVLKKTDGTEITVPLSKLDDKSRLRARALAKAPPAESLQSSTTDSDANGSSESNSSISETPVVFSDGQSAQQFVEIIERELSKKNFLVVWDALPAKKQKEVQELVRLASSRVEQRTLDLIKRFRNEVLTVLRTKKEFVLNSQAIPFPPEQLDVLTNGYDSIVNYVEALLPTDLLDEKTIQDNEIRDVARKYLSNLIAKSDALERKIPANSPLRAAQTELKLDLKVESSTAQEATISFLPPGQMNRMPLKFILSDGRWLPADLIQNWDQAMSQVNSSLQAVVPKELHMKIGQGLIAANSVLGSVGNTETQEDFDQVIGTFMGMLGGGMMGGGGMPSGGTPGGAMAGSGFGGNSGAGMQAGGAITYVSHIAPIMRSRCAPCHFPSQGGNKGSLEDFASTRQIAEEILERVQLDPGAKGFMPQRKEKLSANDIQTIKTWISQGMPEGAAAGGSNNGGGGGSSGGGRVRPGRGGGAS